MKRILLLLLCALLPTKRTVPAAQAGGFDTPGAVLTVAFRCSVPWKTPAA